MSSGTTSREQLDPSSLSANAIRSAPYSYRAPSPPLIHIPTPKRSKSPQFAMELIPSFEDIDPNQLTSLQIITGNRRQVAQDPTASWLYENRRQAHAILDFLYLGPTSVICDHAFLTREGITMMLVVRSSSLAEKKSPSVEEASNTLKIPSHYMYANGVQDLIGGFPDAIRLINNHMLAVYHSQSIGSDGDGQIIVPSCNVRRGKVLVTCDSGNDKSAAIVAAYIMSVYRSDIVRTLQFIGLKRFCCTFDEDSKRILLSFEILLNASWDVSRHERHQALETAQPEQSDLFPHSQQGMGSAIGSQTSASKRGLDGMMDLNEDDCQDSGGAPIADPDRFIDRGSLAPFADARHGN